MAETSPSRSLRPDVKDTGSLLSVLSSSMQIHAALRYVIVKPLSLHLSDIRAGP